MAARIVSRSSNAAVQAVVFAWFPKAFTGGCTVECESIWCQRAELRSWTQHVLRRLAWIARRRIVGSPRRSGSTCPILSDPER